MRVRLGVRLVLSTFRRATLHFGRCWTCATGLLPELAAASVVAAEAAGPGAAKATHATRRPIRQKRLTADLRRDGFAMPGFLSCELAIERSLAPLPLDG